MNIGKKYTFWEFIKEQHGIAIPIIQRDYAQGREGKGELRKRFLGNLKNALECNGSLTLILDFVYGIQGKDEKVIPLDGQQRLTTLWLLHWYIFLKSDNIRIKHFLNIFQSFTYRTRISSRCFCEALCNHKYFRKLRECQEIRKGIVSQAWFMSEWEQDPTVKAMLNMLGGEDQSVESLFNGCNFNILWERLTSSRDCPISFYYLPIDGEILQDPDDIYIKMNARGEHLTDFENFKADLNKHVRNKRLEWKDFDDVHPELKLSRLIDIEWADVFWKDLPEKQKSRVLHKSNDSDLVLPNTDKQFFAFINRFFVNRLLSITKLNAKKLNEEKTKEKEAILFQYLYGKDGHADISIIYKDFQIYENAGVISASIFNSLKKIFKNLNKLDFNKYQPSWNSKEKFHYLPYVDKQKKQNTSEEQLEEISQIHRVVFLGICCYLENCQYPREFDDNSFKEWMRFVWNMAKNSDVNTVDSMKNVLQKLHSIKEYTHDIILYLVYRAKPTENKTYFERQWNEEIMKAKRLRYMKVEKAKLGIKQDTNIFEAEHYFHGNIRFLLNEKGCYSMLNEKIIQNANKFILNSQKDYKRILKLLPYFEPEKIWDKELILKSDDYIKLINYDDRIIFAIQHFLMDNNKRKKETNIDKESWIYPLIIQDKKGNTLFGYSNSFKIHVHDGKVYLYNKTNWSKDCILLFSDDIMYRIVIRNNIIAHLTKKGYEFVFDYPDATNISIYPSKELEGRNIVLMKQNSYVVIGL